MTNSTSNNCPRQTIKALMCQDPNNPAYGYSAHFDEAQRKLFIEALSNLIQDLESDEPIGLTHEARIKLEESRLLLGCLEDMHNEELKQPSCGQVTYGLCL